MVMCALVRGLTVMCDPLDRLLLLTAVGGGANRVGGGTKFW